MLSQAGDFLNELYHFIALKLAGFVLVELTEALVEVIVVESGAVTNVIKSVLDKALGLFFVKITIAIVVVLVPDIVHTLSNHVIDFSSFVFFFNKLLISCIIGCLGRFLW